MHDDHKSADDADDKPVGMNDDSGGTKPDEDEAVDKADEKGKEGCEFC